MEIFTSCPTSWYVNLVGRTKTNRWTILYGYQSGDSSHTCKKCWLFFVLFYTQNTPENETALLCKVFPLSVGGVFTKYIPQLGAYHFGGMGDINKSVHSDKTLFYLKLDRFPFLNLDVH